MLAIQDVHLQGLSAISPELALIFVSLVVLVIDLVKNGRNSHIIGWTSLAGLAVTSFLLVGAFDDPIEEAFGLVVVDKFGNFFKLFTCAALAVVIGFVLADKRERKHNIGEYYFLLLSAGIGIFFMVGTNNLLLLMLGLELLSLASYSLAGFHKGVKRSAEAAMKYIVFGGWKKIFEKRWDTTLGEDNDISARQQRGLSSPFAQPGRLSHLEPLVPELAQWWLNRILPEG